MKEGNISLRHRIFNAVFLVGICMSFSCSLINWLLGLGLLPTVLTALCGIITVGLYVAFRKTRNYEVLSLIVVVFLSFVFFPIMWLFAGGTYTSIPYYIIVNAGIIALLLVGLKRKIVLFLFTLFVGTLMIIEYKIPDLVFEYGSPLE